VIDTDLILLGASLFAFLAFLEVVNLMSQSFPALKPAGRVIAGRWPNLVLYSLAIVLLWTGFFFRICFTAFGFTEEHLTIFLTDAINILAVVFTNAGCVLVVAALNHIRFVQGGLKAFRGPETIGEYTLQETLREKDPVEAAVAVIEMFEKRPLKAPYVAEKQAILARTDRVGEVYREAYRRLEESQEGLRSS